MEGLALKIGAFIGTVLGHVLKIAGPQIEELIANVYRRLLKDSAEVGKPNNALDNAWVRGNETRSPNSGADRLGFKAREGVRGVSEREGGA